LLKESQAIFLFLERHLHRNFPEDHFKERLDVMGVDQSKQQRSCDKKGFWKL
jgi:hypothetical protein